MLMRFTSTPLLLHQRHELAQSLVSFFSYIHTHNYTHWSRDLTRMFLTSCNGTREKWEIRVLAYQFDRAWEMDVERSSRCNCMVNFLQEERYMLTAFDLLHELLNNGRDAQAIRLKVLFFDPSQLSPDQISCFNSLRKTNVIGRQRVFSRQRSQQGK